MQCTILGTIAYLTRGLSYHASVSPMQPPHATHARPKIGLPFVRQVSVSLFVVEVSTHRLRLPRDAKHIPRAHNHISKDVAMR